RLSGGERLLPEHDLAGLFSHARGKVQFELENLPAQIARTHAAENLSLLFDRPKRRQNVVAFDFPIDPQPFATKYFAIFRPRRGDHAPKRRDIEGVVVELTMRHAELESAGREFAGTIPKNIAAQDAQK